MKGVINAKYSDHHVFHKNVSLKMVLGAQSYKEIIHISISTLPSYIYSTIQFARQSYL